MKKERPALFERLERALDDGLRYARGEINLKTTSVRIPDPPKKLTPEQIRNLRLKLHFSQSAFAKLLVVSPKTIQSWEQGNRTPTGSASRLLQLLESPELVKSFVGQVAG
ncbi:helix-turn-helix domain-containing protein [bacterium]|nr:helix-turn-helix domain-containing protein [bacterium]